MKKPYKARRIEKSVDGKWVKCEFLDLKKKDIFRMFEPDTNEPVVDQFNRTDWKATGNAYTDKKTGVGTIECDFPEEKNND